MTKLKSVSQSFFFEKELVLEKKVGLMKFAHLTYSDVVESILKNGFIAGDGNLGIGIYCCDLNNQASVNALIDFHGDLTEGEDEMSIIVGSYDGQRLECIDAMNPYQMYNKGFVLLTDPNQISIAEVHTIPVAEITHVLRRLADKDHPYIF